METIKIRITVPSEKVHNLVRNIRESLESTGCLTLVDESEPYLCRNPNLTNVYLTFVDLEEKM